MRFSSIAFLLSSQSWNQQPSSLPSTPWIPSSPPPTCTSTSSTALPMSTNYLDSLNGPTPPQQQQPRRPSSPGPLARVSPKRSAGGGGGALARRPSNVDASTSAGLVRGDGFANRSELQGMWQIRRDVDVNPRPVSSFASVEGVDPRSTGIRQDTDVNPRPVSSFASVEGVDPRSTGIRHDTDVNPLPVMGRPGSFVHKDRPWIRHDTDTNPLPVGTDASPLAPPRSRALPPPSSSARPAPTKTSRMLPGSKPANALAKKASPFTNDFWFQHAHKK